MMNNDSSLIIYNNLLKELGPKAVSSLQNIKKACDYIIKFRGQLNYSQVGRYCEDAFGTPKTQSILNNSRLKQYIASRIIEYQQDKKYSDYPSSTKKTRSSKYPSDDLDIKTKTYIDLLISRNELLENTNIQLSKSISDLTKVSPLNLSEAIASGASADGSMDLAYSPNNNVKLNALKDAITALLDLPIHLPNTLVTEQRDDKLMLLLKRPAGDLIILRPEQFDEINELLDYLNNLD